MEHLYIIISSLHTAPFVQDAADGDFILLRSARIIFTYGNAVHVPTSRACGFSLSLYHACFHMTSHAGLPFHT